VHHEPDVQDLGSRPEIKTEDGSRIILRRFHLIMALVVGLPISDYELDDLEDGDADELLEGVMKILERRQAGTAFVS
jgi:hypothetical protein